MSVNIAINGFGRIGRLIYRSLIKRNMLDQKINVTVVNDSNPLVNTAYLLKYDSVHGKLLEDVKINGDNIEVGQYNFEKLQLKVSPNELPWEEKNIDIVIESTGVFEKKKEAVKHIEAGAKKVIISAPSDEDVPTIVMGVNDNLYQGQQIISCASCTTNCLAPLVYILVKEGIGIEEGLMTTCHAFTASQALVDGSSQEEFRRDRAATINMIPTTTGAAKSIGEIIPEVKGKLTGISVRVPIPNVSLLDLTFRSIKETSLEEINFLINKASDTYLKNIFEYSEEEIVSSDINHSSVSGVYDSKSSIGLNSRFFKLLAWYDNEWGYANRVVDLLEKIIA